MGRDPRWCAIRPISSAPPSVAEGESGRSFPPIPGEQCPLRHEVRALQRQNERFQEQQAIRSIPVYQQPLQVMLVAMPPPPPATRLVHALKNSIAHECGEMQSWARTQSQIWTVIALAQQHLQRILGGRPERLHHHDARHLPSDRPPSQSYRHHQKRHFAPSHHHHHHHHRHHHHHHCHLHLLHASFRLRPEKQARNAATSPETQLHPSPSPRLHLAIPQAHPLHASIALAKSTPLKVHWNRHRSLRHSRPNWPQHQPCSDHPTQTQT